MTERMEPTNRLRWLSRTTRAPDGLVEIWHPKVLQQLWQGHQHGYGTDELIEEWRDVPVENA